METIYAARSKDCPRPESSTWDGNEYAVRVSAAGDGKRYYTGKAGREYLSPNPDHAFRYCTLAGAEFKSQALYFRGMMPEVVRIV